MAFSAACRARSASAGVGLLVYRSELAVETLRPRLREAGIQRDGLLVEAELPAQAGGIVAACRGPPRPSGRRRRRRGSAWASPKAASPRPPRARHPTPAPPSSRCRTGPEDVRDRRVERLLPPGGRRAVALHLDQLRADLHAVAAAALLPAHGRRQQITGIELLARSPGRLVVFLYGVELPRAITSRPGSDVSLPRTASAMPSAK